MAILAAFLVAVLVAALLYEGLPVAASVRVEQYETVAGLRPAGQGRLPFWRAVLVPFNRLGRNLPSSLAGRARRQLYWAQRAGAWVGWDEASFLGLRLAGAVVGFLLTASAPMGILVAGAFLGWWLPGMMLAGRARRVERAFRRELPDVAHLLSMLVSAGLSVGQALERIAAQRGLVARWLGEGLAQSRGQRRGSGNGWGLQRIARGCRRRRRGLCVERREEVGDAALANENCDRHGVVLRRGAGLAQHRARAAIGGCPWAVFGRGILWVRRGRGLWICLAGSGS
jgi:hypothetical protein